ncbi:actin cytoskeleton-regulatory complex protein pan-1-like [Gopherus evgoodei]|uniref:actin cytoskeleton-regulatory complex protein pan-1-like n=1 Tax=Gopherus evgoodei TaxID=1825980 RepID=UPI0011CF68D8|nr:actin cytoskeleton-regulatory complex protein pan-1-like [Gopherus evgoodei]
MARVCCYFCCWLFFVCVLGWGWAERTHTGISSTTGSLGSARRGAAQLGSAPGSAQGGAWHRVSQKMVLGTQAGGEETEKTQPLSRGSCEATCDNSPLCGAAAAGRVRWLWGGHRPLCSYGKEKLTSSPPPPQHQLRTGIAPDCSRPPAPPLPHRIPPLSPPRAAPQPPPLPPPPRQDTGQSRTGGSLWWGRGMGLLPPPQLQGGEPRRPLSSRGMSAMVGGRRRSRGCARILAGARRLDRAGRAAPLLTGSVFHRLHTAQRQARLDPALYLSEFSGDMGTLARAGTSLPASQRELRLRYTNRSNRRSRPNKDARLWGYAKPI